MLRHVAWYIFWAFRMSVALSYAWTNSEMGVNLKM